MEKLFSKFIRVFYALMIFTFLLVILKHLCVGALGLVICVVASASAFFYISALIYNIKAKYVEGRIVLILLAVLNIAMLILITIDYSLQGRF